MHSVLLWCLTIRYKSADLTIEQHTSFGECYQDQLSTIDMIKTSAEERGIDMQLQHMSLCVLQYILMLVSANMAFKSVLSIFEI